MTAHRIVRAAEPIVWPPGLEYLPADTHVHHCTGCDYTATNPAAAARHEAEHADAVPDLFDLADDGSALVGLLVGLVLLVLGVLVGLTSPVMSGGHLIAAPVLILTGGGLLARG